MPTNRRPLRRGSRLTKPDSWEQDVSVERWAAWRDDLMAAVTSHPGKRPAAWWLHDSPQPRDIDKHQSQQLFELDQLHGDELNEVTARWRKWEAKAASGLAFVAGPGEVLEGADAYAAWLVWAGVPAELAGKWQAARTARARVIAGMG